MGDNTTFYTEIIRGLSAEPKRLPSKYFYDGRGDLLFQEIMRCPEYYLTRCELEILSGQANEIVRALSDRLPHFEVVELGAGDATKSSFLLEACLAQGVACSFYPVDISSQIIHSLENDLPEKFPGMHIKGWNGEYLDMLEQINRYSGKRKCLLFLGSNIGNFLPKEAVAFLKAVRGKLTPGDLLLIGFDLRKHPKVILDAYNDKGGLTRDFNLNLLSRINRELTADFVPENFDHYPCYDPVGGACKSFLVSLCSQQVHIGREIISFAQNEVLHMEVSQKYSPEETDRLAAESGFRPVAKFYDRKKWFLDSLWQA